jgi:hypothetical protein
VTVDVVQEVATELEETHCVGNWVEHGNISQKLCFSRGEFVRTKKI